MWIVLEATIDTTTTLDHRFLPHLAQIIKFPSKHDGGQLSLSLEMIDYADFAHIM